MSHVVTGEAEITDLDAFEAACPNLGLELVRDQTTFKWYGTHVGDYPLPAGFRKEDMGHCHHAVRVKGKPGAYEIGLVPRRDGKPGWLLMYDFFAGGRGLMECISKDGARGKDAVKLQHEYAATKSIRRAQRLGFRHTLTRNPAGMVQKLSIYR